MSDNDMITERLTMEGVEILFKNFSGTKSQYNTEGRRNFSILIDDPAFAKQLTSRGWNVKSLRSDDESEKYHLPVHVNYEGRYPPRVYAIKTSGKLSLNEETVPMLDLLRVRCVDVVINPYNWTVNGESGVKAYLNSLFAVIDEDEFDIKYNELPELAS